MVEVVKTVGTNSRDYSTWPLWEADLDGASYGVGDDARGDGYNDSPFDDTLNVNGGSNLNSIVMTAPEGERHDGTAGTGVRHVFTGEKNILLNTDVLLSIEWHEVDMNGNSTPGGNGSIYSNITVAQVTFGIYNNLVHGLNEVGGFEYGIQCINGGVVFNNFVYDLTLDTASGGFAGIRHQAGVNYVGDVSNNTVHDVHQARAAGTGLCDGLLIQNDSSGNPNEAYNNIVTDTTNAGSGATNDYSMGLVNNLASHNLSSDATAPGANSLINKASADQYVSTVLGSEDLHLVATADAKDAGLDRGSSPPKINIDIDGQDRTVMAGPAWDMGGHEFASVGLQDIYVGGQQVQSINVGNQSVSEVYIGSTKVWG